MTHPLALKDCHGQHSRLATDLLFDHAHSGDVEGVARALAEGADIHAKDLQGGTPAMIAAGCGRERCLGMLIDAGANANAQDDAGWTASICAAFHGHEACLRLLVKAGADIHAANCHGFLPAMAAAGNGHESCLRLLVDWGANLDAADMEGRTAAALAAANGHRQIVELIRSSSLAHSERLELASIQPEPSGNPASRRAVRV